MNATGRRKTEDEQPDWLEAGEFLKLEMARKGYNAAQLADKIEVSRQSIYNITGETKRPISVGLAQKFSRELGGSIEFWLGSRFPNYSKSELADSGLGPSIRHGLLTDKQIRDLNGSDDDGFVISPLPQEQLKGASFDLTVGLIVVDGFDAIPKENRDLWFHFYELEVSPENFHPGMRAELIRRRDEGGVRCVDAYELPPGQSVYVIAAERVRLGPRYLCQIGPISEVNLRGLVVHCGHQIDPGFNGPLVFRVKNDLSGKLWLRRGDDLASLTVFALPEPVERRYEENLASRIRAVIDKLQRAFAARIELRDTRQGCELRFMGPGAQTFAGADSQAVLHDFFAAIDQAIAGDSDEAFAGAIEAVFESIELHAQEIEHLAEFLELDEGRRDQMRARIARGDVEPRLDIILDRMASGRSLALPRYLRKIVSELSSLVYDMDGFVT